MKLEILVKYTDDKNEFFILKEDISAKIDEKASLILKHVLPLLTSLADAKHITPFLDELSLSRLVYPDDTTNEYVEDEFGNKKETDVDFRKRYKRFMKEQDQKMQTLTEETLIAQQHINSSLTEEDIKEMKA